MRRNQKFAIDVKTETSSLHNFDNAANTLVALDCFSIIPKVHAKDREETIKTGFYDDSFGYLLAINGASQANPILLHGSAPKSLYRQALSDCGN